jgi:Bifunctional DNA primase/polymerase, N-terminal/Primase C terminal 2 (PriCT-2)
MNAKAIDAIISSLENLPTHWHLVPTHWKRPLGYRWEQRPFTPRQLQSELASTGKVRVLDRRKGFTQVSPTGVALICGANSQEFLVAVDCDGISAYKQVLTSNFSNENDKNSKFVNFSLGEIKNAALAYLPHTVAFTSGRPHRAQYLYRLPLHLSFPLENLKSRRMHTRERECLELRGKNLSSVLPPSGHPQGYCYQWLLGCSPSEVEIANAPDWIVGKMLVSAEKTRRHTHDSTSIRQDCVTSRYAHLYPGIDVNIQQALILLEVIHPKFADSYDTWLYVGMALHSVSPTLLPSWEQWSQLSPKYKPGECQYKWKTFNKFGITIKTLYRLAYLS